MSPHIFLVAGEESGDRLGAALIAAIKQRTNGQVHFSGVGGAHMAAEGVPSLFALGDLAIIGFATIPKSLPKILRRIREAADAVVSAKPDALVIIDSPEFTHRVAKRVRAKLPEIPIVDYVCPSVWAWRPGRARAMRAYVDHVLALLPFEPKVLAELGGPPCTYVGHPLVERLDDLRPKDLERRLRLANPPLVLVLPGSREGEIRRMASVFGAAIARVIEQFGPAEVVVPAVSRLADTVRAAVASWPIPARVVTDAEEKAEAFRSARVALSKSGTSTLELALAGVPMIAAYKVPLIEEIAGRLLLNVPSVILANLVLGENVVPEFLQRDCTPARLADALLPLLSDTPERQRQTQAFVRLDTLMEVGKGNPSNRGAGIVLDIAQERHVKNREIPAMLQPSV
jgi:lipid-A-disaccharide synthase